MSLRGWIAPAVVVLLASSAHATSLFDPALRFRQIPTEHFVVYFHQGEEQTAQRLATIAEETWRALEKPLGVCPPKMTQVVLVDQTELFNGYATPLPRDTVVIFATWPTGAEFDVDDWLRLAFTHEFTHIVHLDRSESWARVVRGVFGRTTFAFPNLFLPTWQIEGLAVYEESAITGEGRLHAGDFRAIVGEAGRAGRLEPLDRVNGGLTDWPSGTAPYAYGVGFHNYLAERFGADSLAKLADATARRVPFTGSRAFGKVYGESLGDLWRDYEASERAASESPAPADVGLTRLTHHGFEVAGPRFDRFACATCPPEVFYSVVNANGFPALHSVTLDGTSPRHIVHRYHGAGTAIGRDAIYFDQIERRRNVSLFSDLYALSRTDGHVRAMTSESRLLDPDLSPDGETLACVQSHPGRRDLVLVRLPPSPLRGFGPTAIVTLLSEPETQFNRPRFSPDGRSIVVERHRPGALSEVVIVDVSTRAVRLVASDPDARMATPTWRPDGNAIVVALAPRDEPFNLYEFSANGTPARQLTHVRGSATSADISPDGKTIVFVGYTPDGFDLFTMPYPPSQASGAGAGADAVSGARTAPDPADWAARATPVDVPGSRPYSPLQTLAPTSWSPIVEAGGNQVRIGAGLAGFDVLGYHFYAASATWGVTSPAGAPTVTRAEPDWQAYYAYARWRPTLFLAASTQTTFFGGPPSEAGTPTASTLREREIEAGVLLPSQHVRVSHQGLLSLRRAVNDYTLPTETVSRDRAAARAAWQTVSTKTYGYSISAEDGVAIGATGEFVRRGLGAFADATTVTADARAYLPGLSAHHVVALRAAAGTSTGEAAAGRTFLLGGPGPDASTLDFGSSAISVLRGFGSNTFAGRHVALANAEYRFPIARPQRGIGTWPAFLHTIHAAIFADTGHAWTNTFSAASIKTSFGGELSARIVAGYYFPLTATVGAAWGHDGSGHLADGATVYLRIGKSF